MIRKALANGHEEHPEAQWPNSCGVERRFVVKEIQTYTDRIPHRIHGTGIFTYMDGWFLWVFMDRYIYQATMDPSWVPGGWTCELLESSEDQQVPGIHLGVAKTVVHSG